MSTLVNKTCTQACQLNKKNKINNVTYEYVHKLNYAYATKNCSSYPTGKGTAKFSYGK